MALGKLNIHVQKNKAGPFVTGHVTRYLLRRGNNMTEAETPEARVCVVAREAWLRPVSGAGQAPKAAHAMLSWSIILKAQGG